MDEILTLQSLFQTLGDASRLKIIYCIGEKECSVSEIVEFTGLSQPLVSHHLKAMRDKQILETYRKGPFIYYKLKDKRLLSALGIFLELNISCDANIKNKSTLCSPQWWTDHWNKY